MIKKLLLITVCLILIGTVLIPICIESEETLAVVVVTGQSNGQYRELNVNLEEMDELGLPNHNVYYYGTNTMPIYYRNSNDSSTVDFTFQSYDIHSMLNEDKTAWKIGCGDAPLALFTSEKYDCDVLVINTAVGGASILFFDPTKDGAKYCKNVIDHALQDIKHLGKNYSVVKVGYVWIQGEANKYNTVSTYISEFKKINSFYHGLGFYECFMVQTRPENGGNASTAQLQICATMPDVILASTAPATFTTENGLLASDNLHYTQEGRIVVMEDVAAAMPNELSKEFSVIAAIPIIVIAAVIVAITGLYFNARREGKA